MRRTYSNLINIAFILILLMFLFISPTFARGMEEHINGFKEVVSKANENKFYRYGIYSSRIMAVKNPEIYLKGDMLFADVITSTKGMKRAYENDNVRSMDFRGINNWGSEFSFEDIKLSQKKLISFSEIYPNGYPILNYLDQRISPIHTTLKVNKITSLEGANLVYIKKRMLGSPKNDTYLIFTRQNKGYVYSQSKFYNCMNNKINIDEIGDPILIFNEQFVWYPLMKRDDRSKSEMLNKLVSNLKGDKVLPKISMPERNIILKLQESSQLNNNKQKDFASLISTHSNGVRNKFKGDFIDKWSQCLSNIDSSLASQNINVLSMKIGNKLSPNTAYLASLTNLDQIAEEYLKYVGVNVSGEREAWGHTWPCTLIENNIDDAYRTKGGHCVSQATNLSSVFDLKGVENIVIKYGYKNKNITHTVVISPQNKVWFNNAIKRTKKDAKEIYNKGIKKTTKEVIYKDYLLVNSYKNILTNTHPEKALSIYSSVLNEAENVGYITGDYYQDRKISEPLFKTKIKLP